MKRIVSRLVVGFALLFGGVGASYADAEDDFWRPGQATKRNVGPVPGDHNQ
jgi:hypothetical protein